MKVALAYECRFWELDAAGSGHVTIDILLTNAAYGLRNWGKLSRHFFPGHVHIVITVLSESDSYETIEVQRMLKSIGTDLSFIVRVVIVALKASLLVFPR